MPGTGEVDDAEIEPIQPGTLELLDRTAVLVGGAASALATGVAMVVAAGTVSALGEFGMALGLVVLLGALIAYDVTLVLAKPAILPGLYGAVRARSSAAGAGTGLRAFGTAVRRHYVDVARALLVSRVAAYGYAVLVGVVVGSVALIGATAVSALLYANGAVETPRPHQFKTALVGLVAFARAAGLVPVSLTEVLAIDGTTPRRAWLASRSLYRVDPAARSAARRRILLGTVPILAGVAATTAPDLPNGPAGWVMIAAVVVLVGSITKAVEAVSIVRQFDVLDRPTPTDPGSPDWRGRLDPRAYSPSRRTLLAVLLVAGLAVGSAGVRVADVGVDAGPDESEALAAPGTAPPGDLYHTAWLRTLGSSRSATATTVDANWTTSTPRWSRRVAATVDYGARELHVEGSNHTGDTPQPLGQGYATDRLLYREGPDGHSATMTFPTATWGLTSRPMYGHVSPDGLPVWNLRLVGPWERRAGANGTTVLTVDDPAAVRNATHTADRPSVEYLDESRIRIAIDEDTQRIDRATVVDRYLVYETQARDRVVDRVHRERTVEFRYDDVDVARPDDVGFQITSLVWDVVYY